MKRILILFLVLSVLCCLTACGTLKQSEDMMRENILNTSEYQLKKELIGQYRQEILDRFGDPDVILNGVRGDVFLIPYSEQMLIVYYDEDGIVSSIHIELREQ